MADFLTRAVLTEIDGILRKPPQTLLRARMVASIKKASLPENDTFKYFYYTPEGSAEVYAIGQFASNIPLIGEKGGWVEHSGFAIANAFSLSESEVMMLKRSADKGLTPPVDVQANRISDCRDFIYKSENRTFFLGNSKLGMQGLLNFSKTMTIDGVSKTFAVTSEDVADGATGTGDAKKYWKNKTAKEIITDIFKGINTIKAVKVNGESIFEPNTLILPDVTYTRLLEPYSDTVPTYSILQFLRDNQIFQNIYAFPELNKSYTGFSHDCFVVMDNRPSVIELGLFYDAAVHPENAQDDGNGNLKIPVRMKTGGCMLYHPSAVYRGNKIGDGNP